MVRVRNQRPPPLERGAAEASRWLHKRSSSSPTRHPGIRHKRDLDFRSSVSYYSHALSKTSQSESCSKAATLQRQDTADRTRLQNKQPCVASSRSPPSRAPRPTSRSENHGAISPYEAAAPRSNPAASSPRHQLKGAAPLLIVGGGSRLAKERERCPSRYS